MHPRAWRREYEIDWASPEGEPVIPEFVEATHVRDFLVDPTLRLLRFWDFGFDSPVVLFAQLTLWDQLRVVYELCPFNVTLRELIPAAQSVEKNLLGLDRFLGGERASDFAGRELDAEDAEKRRFAFDYKQTEGFTRETPADPKLRTFDAGDPEGYSRKSLGIEASVMAQHGLRLHINRPGTKESYQDLRARFLRQVMVPNRGPEPAILIHSRCRILRQALGGAFCRSVIPPYKPKAQHPFKDVADALRYGNDNLESVKRGLDARLRRLATQDVQETRS